MKAGPQMEAARLLLAALAPRDRAALLAELAGPPATTPAPERLLRRASAADRLGCSVRLVDKLARAGTLTRVRLPGRTRAAGFRLAEVERLVIGRDGTA